MRNSYKAALKRKEQSTRVAKFNVGELSFVCSHCSAKLFSGERKGLCCKDGKVVLPQPNPLPEALKTLYCTNLEFVKNIRKYNQAFAFTSLGVKVDERLASATNGVYTFRINGMLSHRIGGLLPVGDNLPKFAQIYFTGDQEQPALRNQHFGNVLDQQLLANIQQVLIQHNPYVQLLRQAREVAAESPCLSLKIQSTGNLDNRRYNLPTTEEVAAIIVDQEPDRQCRDLIIHLKDGRLQRIKETCQVHIFLNYRPTMLSHTLCFFRMEKQGGIPEFDFRELLKLERSSPVLIL